MLSRLYTFAHVTSSLHLLPPLHPLNPSHPLTVQSKSTYSEEPFLTSRYPLPPPTRCKYFIQLTSIALAFTSLTLSLLCFGYNNLCICLILILPPHPDYKLYQKTIFTLHSSLYHLLLLVQANSECSINNY